MRSRALAGGRRDPKVYIGYVFLFFYGLERRAIIDQSDISLIREEVVRLLTLYGTNNSFRGYATSLLAVTSTETVSSCDETTMQEGLLPHISSSPAALAWVLAWYHARACPLPADIAVTVAESMEDAKRSVVLTRARERFLDLFTIRYRERYGDGMILSATDRPRVIHHHAASAGIVSYVSNGATVPDVLGNHAQFESLIGIWNACVEDLRRYASAQRKGGSEAGDLTAAMWEAMPPDLRTQHDHPDRDSWDNLVFGAPRCGPGHLLTAAELAVVAHLSSNERYSATQARRIADTASHLGYAIEPDPRVASASVRSDTRFVLWHTPVTSPPDADLYRSLSTALALAVHIATADDHTSREEITAVTSFVENLFTLDDGLRRRVEALRDLLLLEPVKVGPIGKRLVQSRTPEQRLVVGRLLVAIAGADHDISEAELKALRGLYKSFELPPSALDEALATTGVRLRTNEVGREGRGRTSKRRVPGASPASASAERGPTDQRTIDAIMADSRTAAVLLSDVGVTTDDDVDKDE